MRLSTSIYVYFIPECASSSEDGSTISLLYQNGKDKHYLNSLFDSKTPEILNKQHVLSRSAPQMSSTITNIMRYFSCALEIRQFHFDINIPGLAWVLSVEVTFKSVRNHFEIGFYERLVVFDWTLRFFF